MSEHDIEPGVARVNRIARMMFAVVCAAICLLALHKPAAAKSFECVQNKMTARVAQNGTLGVTEERTFEFDGSYSLIGYTFDPPANGTYKLKGVWYQPQGGEKTALKQVEFKESWRDAGGPAPGNFALDKEEDTVYCFAAYGSKGTLTLSYNYTNAVDVYTDVAELYWKFIPEGWDIDTSNVTLDLALPAPEGANIVAGDNVRAWGHGSLAGNVSIGEDGVIRFTVPEVRGGTFAEARTTFPTSWVPKVASVKQHDTAHLDKVLEEEQGWANDANRQRLLLRLAYLVPTGLSVIAIIVVFVLYLIYGREYKPTFTDKYWRDVPAKGVHPAVVGRVYRFDKPDTKDLTATLMYLSTRGYIQIERRQTQHERPLGLGTKVKDEYVLRRTGKSTNRLDDLSTHVMGLIFDKLGKKTDEISLEEIQEIAHENLASFTESLDRWNSKVGTAVLKGEYFDKKSDSVATMVKGLSVTYFMAMLFVACIFLDGSAMGLAIVSAIVAALVAYLLSRKITRRTQEGADITARCKALKAWFKDFTNLKESIPTEVKV